MKLYRLHRTQCLPVSMAEAWDFFSNPQNLPHITPPFLHFQVTSPLPGKMYPGMIITYQITSAWRIPVRWITEITHVVEPYLFVDEQRFGPYRLWHHQHLFREITGGIEMQDIVHYALPLGWFGRTVHEFLVRHRLREIFDFRQQVLENMFGAMDVDETQTNTVKHSL